jgi:hypothetical protein
VDNVIGARVRVLTVLWAVFVYFDDQGSWYDTPPGSVFSAFLFLKNQKTNLATINRE